MRNPRVDLFDAEGRPFGDGLDRIGLACAAPCSTPLPPSSSAQSSDEEGE